MQQKVDQQDTLSAAQQHAAAGRLSEALATLDLAEDRGPADAPLYKFKSAILFRLGRRQEAFAAAETAYWLRPDDLRHGLDLAYNLARAGLRADALRIAEAVQEQAPEDPHMRDALGSILTHCERPEAAEPHYQYCCSVLPNEPHFRYNLASVQRMLGKTLEAEANLDAALEIAPKDAQAHLARSQLRKQTDCANHVGTLADLEKELAGFEDAIPLGYALAKELDDLGFYSRSFQALARAADLARSLYRYDPAPEIAAVAALKSSFDLGFDCPPSHSKASPIFVVGLPRSGTTLIERILSASSGVRSEGEPNAFVGALHETCGGSTGAPVEMDKLLGEFARDPSRVAESYLRRVGYGGDATRLLDKTPGNAIYAGLILKAFPKARIICVRRNPVASCFAMYRTLFARGAYAFSYDLRDLARYFAAWNGLMETWAECLGKQFLSIAYEDLVSDPETWMRRLTSHANVPWDENISRFHEQTSPVTTESAGQADRAIYTSSVARWTPYSELLAPLIAQLRAGGIVLPS